MSFALITPLSFERHARKFLKRNPELADEFAAVLLQLERDPFEPKLRLHPLRGQHKGKHAASLTYSHRIVLILAVVSKEIVLLDVGTHDEVYR